MNTPHPIPRRQFLKSTALAATAAIAIPSLHAMETKTTSSTTKILRPRCITMWDFSWIERRWPGAGYEDWPRVLDELRERGYDAVRIDAFPHLVATAPEKEWTLLPVWNVQDWGSPALNKIGRVQSCLHEFIGLCRDRGIKVGLSTWYREDTDNTRLKIATPQIMAEQWNATLAGIKHAGLLDTILYVDLCNEWPGDIWTPFFANEPPQPTFGAWDTPRSLAWMRTATREVQQAFPELPVSFSFMSLDHNKLKSQDLSFLDYAEPHLWMAQANNAEFYKICDYNYERFDLKGYNNLVERAERTYRQRPEYWQRVLVEWIGTAAAAFRPHRLPLMTTECWGVVDYKDWPLLNWNWVKDLCRLGLETAAGTGQWVAIASSNFCGPQFRGMWRDLAWHTRATDLIKRSAIHPELLKTKLAARL